MIFRVKNLIFLLVMVFLMTEGLSAWDLQFAEKPQFVTYKFPEDRLPRHPTTK